MTDDLLSFVDTTLPLVVLRLPTVVNGRTVRTLIEGVDSLQMRRVPYMLLIDTSATTKFPAQADRTLLTDWMTAPEVKAREAKYNIGSALVVKSGPARAIIAALHWIHRPVKPQLLVATLVEAVQWSCDRIVEAGFPLTPAIEAFRAQSLALARAAPRTNPRA